MTQYQRINVAYACIPTSAIDYRMFHILMPLEEDDELTFVGSRCSESGTGRRNSSTLGTIRGNPRNTGFMKNAVVVDCILRDGDVKKEVSIKIFRNYLHFCKSREISLCDRVADALCRRLVAMNEKMSDMNWVQQRLALASQDIESIRPHLQVIQESIQRGIQLCHPNLNHAPVMATMSNSRFFIGCPFNCNTLVLDIGSWVEKHSSQFKYRVYYDNAVHTNISIRVTGFQTFKFTIYRTGMMAWSSSPETEATIQPICQELQAMLLELGPRHQIATTAS